MSDTITETPAVTNGAGDVESATNVADGAIAVVASVDLEQAKTDLASLTETAREGFQQAEGAFVKAAKALARIRDEKLLDAVYGVNDKGKPNKPFDAFLAEEFGVTRDAGDKLARAGLIYARIEQDLGPEAAQLALPTSETQLRPMGRLLKSDPKKKLFGKVWKSALAEAEKKGGIVSKPSAEHVRTALTKSARSFAPTGSTRPSASSRREAQVHVADEASPLDKALAEILKSYSDVPVATLRSILLDGIRLAAKHNVTASVVEQSLDSLLNPPAPPAEGEGEGGEQS